MKINANQEFIVVGVAGLIGMFILAMTWSEFKMAAKEHPAVSLFVLGLGLLFMACAFWSTGLSKRSWMKQMGRWKESYDSGKHTNRN